MQLNDNDEQHRKGYTMDTMIQCILHLPEGPKKALLLYRQEPDEPRRRRIKRTRHSTAASRAKVAQLPDAEFDALCRQIARDEITRTRLSDEYQDGIRGVARYEAKREIRSVLEKAAVLEEQIEAEEAAGR
jgi:hypothetical protein